MKFLALLIGGVILGYLIGVVIGESRASSEGGFLTFLIVDTYRYHFAVRGAVVGGIIGAVVGFGTLADRSS